VRKQPLLEDREEPLGFNLEDRGEKRDGLVIARRDDRGGDGEFVSVEIHADRCGSLGSESRIIDQIAQRPGHRRTPGPMDAGPRPVLVEHDGPDPRQ
jgi:hypothetical protein